ncbi:unnamed protein product [Bursaphelenchus xylophilus]|uniref:(pine wood nematode) hypothetical protein n=1 Tax=Bursaphelenchus xylophilus TaxID=6326 RepID=A0A1I7SQQ1_BURXY|nr:unnamed protein product [Bursaphelenchus xylophilus]CAG9110221.1 unnamed protein product [Bursaphelenchus xylophilus]
MFRVYTQRWLVLLVVCLLNFSNAMTWITFAPISYYTNSFYGDRNAATLLNVIFMAVSIPCGIVAFWGVDRFGIRVVCIAGAVFNFLGNLIRFSAVFLSGPARFWLTLFGQALAASIQPFVMYLTTKTAAIWFPNSERVTANTLAALSNSLGVATMYSISPLVVNSNSKVDFMILNGLTSLLTLITLILSFGVTRTAPKTPPSASGDGSTDAGDFKKSLKTLITDKNFIILNMAVGSGVGLFNCLFNNLQPTLCSQGYDVTIISLCGSGMIVAGLVGSAITGVIVDRTKRFNEAYKLCLSMTAICTIPMSLFVLRENQPALVMLSIFCFGFFGLATYPVSLELAVECTFPVPEAFSSGCLIFFGQIFGIIYIIATSLLTTAPTDQMRAHQTCTRVDLDVEILQWNTAQYLWMGSIIATALFSVVLFTPKYQRMEHEKEKTQDLS